MIPPDDPIHPVTKALYGLALFAALVVWAAFATAPTVALGVVGVVVVALVLYDVVTLSRDVRRRHP